jgi:GNAT superfamily N-acetyltransferase
MSSPVEQFLCAVTEYGGFEAEVLALRNANRDRQETQLYVDWRYHRMADAPPPVVFWLRTADGDRIGMASIIFRPYWIGNRQVRVAVVGDISVSKGWRGRGLGRMLLGFMTDYLKEHFPDHPALVIPTESARRSLHAIGWKTGGQIDSYVFVLDATQRLQSLLHNGWVARALGRGFRSAIRAVLHRHVRDDCSLQCDVSIDESMATLWQDLPRSDRVARDLSFPALTWRYIEHPRTRFLAAKLNQGDRLRGFMIFDVDAQQRSCSVYDVIARSPQDCSCMMALFLTHALDRGELATVRIALDNNHPYRKCLRTMGFFVRSPAAPYQVHWCSEAAEEWTLSSGDKDI